MPPNKIKNKLHIIHYLLKQVDIYCKPIISKEKHFCFACKLIKNISYFNTGPVYDNL